MLFNQIRDFIKKYSVSFYSFLMVSLVLFATIWAYIAETFEKSAMSLIKDLGHYHYLTYESVKINKFSLTVTLKKPHVIIPLLGGTLDYKLDRKLFIHYKLFRKKLSIWTNGDTTITYQKDFVTTPILFLPKNNNQNEIYLSLKFKTFLPQLLKYKNSIETIKYALNITDTIDIEGQKLVGWVGKFPMTLNLSFGQLTSPTLLIDSLRSGRILTCKKIHYSFSPKLIINEKTLQNTLVLKDHYSYNNFEIFDYSAPAIQTLLINPMHTFAFDVANKDFSGNKGITTIKLLHQNGAQFLMDAFLKTHDLYAVFRTLYLESKRHGEFSHKGFRQFYSSSVNFNGKKGILDYKSSGSAHFVSDQWKEYFLPYLRLLADMATVTKKSHVPMQFLGSSHEETHEDHDPSDSDLLSVLPHSNELPPHQQNIILRITEQGPILNVTLGLGYEAFDHGASFRMNLPLLKNACFRIFNLLTTFEFTDTELFKGLGVLNIRLKNRKHIFDYIEETANHFQTVVQRSDLGLKISSTRAFMDQLIDRIGDRTSPQSIDVKMAYDFDTNTFMLGNGRSYDDLIVQYFPELMGNGHQCFGGACAHTHHEPHVH